MIGVIASMVMSACFLIAALKHKERGEQRDANKCGIMAAIGLALMVVSIIVELAA